MRSLVLSFYKKIPTTTTTTLSTSKKSLVLWDPVLVMKEIYRGCSDVSQGLLDVLWIRGLPVDPPLSKENKETVWGKSFLFHLASHFSGKITFPNTPPMPMINDKHPYNLGLYNATSAYSKQTMETIIPHHVAYFVQQPSLLPQSQPPQPQPFVRTFIASSPRVLDTLDIPTRTILRKPFYRFSSDSQWKALITPQNTFELYDPRRFTIDCRDHSSMDRYFKLRAHTGRLGITLRLSPGDLLVFNNRKILHSIDDPFLQTQAMHIFKE